MGLVGTIWRNAERVLGDFCQPERDYIAPVSLKSSSVPSFVARPWLAPPLGTARPLGAESSEDVPRGNQRRRAVLPKRRPLAVAGERDHAAPVARTVDREVGGSEREESHRVAVPSIQPGVWWLRIQRTVWHVVSCALSSEHRNHAHGLPRSRRAVGFPAAVDSLQFG